jgi:hypothetical protein
MYKSKAANHIQVSECEPHASGVKYHKFREEKLITQVYI